MLKEMRSFKKILMLSGVKRAVALGQDPTQESCNLWKVKPERFSRLNNSGKLMQRSFKEGGRFQAEELGPFAHVVLNLVSRRIHERGYGLLLHG